MSAGRTETGSERDHGAVATRLSDASFVRVTAAPDGDALAAAGLLVRALRDRDVPFQVRVCPAADHATPEDAVTVRVGDRARGADVGLPRGERPASVEAHAVAAAMDAAPSSTLALAGAVAAGTTPGADGTGPLLEAAERRGRVERRPGVAVPTDDVADGLAHATRVHGPFSGDPEAARALLAELSLPADLDDEARRRVASLVAVETATEAGATPRAADAVGHFLRPYATPSGPFATLGGYADVLDAVARAAPGVGVALALGGRGDVDPREASLDAWRTHASGVHRLLRQGTDARYDGVYVVRTAAADVGRLVTAARLVRDFRSPEPVALVVADGAAAAAATDPRGVRERIAAAGTDDHTGFGGTEAAGVRFADGADADPASEIVAAFREVGKS
jgi:hypothetical protein